MFLLYLVHLYHNNIIFTLLASSFILLFRWVVLLVTYFLLGIWDRALRFHGINVLDKALHPALHE